MWQRDREGGRKRERETERREKRQKREITEIKSFQH
jgi:hypothetical protein